MDIKTLKVICLIALVSLNLPIKAYAQNMKVVNVVTDAVNNVYQNDFRLLEARNGCYRLGYLKSQLELLNDNTDLERKPQRNLNRAIRKLNRGIVSCENGVAPKSLFGMVVELISPSTKTGRSAYRSTKKLLSMQRFNDDVDRFSYENIELARSSQEKLIEAQIEELSEPHRCMLIGEATADADYIAENLTDTVLASKIENATQKLNDSCGTTMGERRYNRRIKKLLSYLDRVELTN